MKNLERKGNSLSTLQIQPCGEKPKYKQMFVLAEHCYPSYSSSEKTENT